jgi:hypothetical protein
MRCLDDGYNYEMETLGIEAKNLSPCWGYGSHKPRERQIIPLRFYEMRGDGTEIDGVTNEEVLTVMLHRLRALNKKFSFLESGIDYIQFPKEVTDIISQMNELANEMRTLTEQLKKKRLSGNPE